MKKILLLVMCVFAIYSSSFAQEDCIGPLTVTIEGASSDSPLDTSDLIIIQPDCGPNGSISIAVSGGSPEYTFQWQKDGIDFSMDQNISDAGAGSYTLSITDDSGCSMEVGPFALTEPDAMQLVADTADPNCNMTGTDFDGTIDLSVSGGVAASGYSYAWTTTDGSGLVAGDQDQSGLGGGTYTVVVTDDNGCTATDSWTLTAPDEFDVTWESLDPVCHTDNGEANGSIDLNVVGGTGEYTYAWTSTDGSGLVSDAGDQTGLGAGTYSLVVTDENGCSIEKSVILETPTAIVVSLSKIDPTCNAENGTSDGSIDITVSGGSGDYTYAWTSDGGTGLDESGSNQTGLGTGTYTVEVTDLNGCSETAEVTLDGPDAIIVDADTVDPSCFGEQDGSITLNTVTGGSGGYSYNWNTVGGTGLNTTAQNQSSIGVGTYMLTITDDSGCAATFEWDLTGPSEIVVTVDDQQDPDCHPNNGPENGTITVSAAGGDETFSYTWTSDNENADLVQGEATQSNLPGGEYTVVVTDGNGCSSEKVIDLTPAQDISVSAQVIPPSCAGNNGSIWLAVSPEADQTYTYVWTTTDGGGITEGTKDQANLDPGTYTVVITNQNDCSKTETYIVPDVSSIEASGEVTSAILCNGDTGAEITVTASGGTGALEYSIDDEATFQDSNIFAGLEAGDYTIIVKDENGCNTDFDITVDEPAQLTAGTCTEAQDLCNANEGEIKVQASGGVAPYTVTWTSTDGSLDQAEGTIEADGESVIFTGAQGGKSYSFTVVDANGCQIPE